MYPKIRRNNSFTSYIILYLYPSNFTNKSISLLNISIMGSKFNIYLYFPTSYISIVISSYPFYFTIGSNPTVQKVILFDLRPKGVEQIPKDFASPWLCPVIWSQITKKTSLMLSKKHRTGKITCYNMLQNGQPTKISYIIYYNLIYL